MNNRPTRIILSCEYGSRHVPLDYEEFFRETDAALQSHGSWDIGADEMARRLAEATGAWLQSGRVTRLLVDYNRRGNDPDLWSEFTRELPRVSKNHIRRVYHHPYRMALHRRIRRLIDEGADVLHIRIRTFTPAFAGKRRKCDVGVCFDPSFDRAQEAGEVLHAWLSFAQSDLSIQTNSPGELMESGIEEWLRENCPADRYAGIVIAFNQDLYARRRQTWRDLQEAVGFYLDVIAGDDTVNKPLDRRNRLDDDLLASR